MDHNKIPERSQVPEEFTWNLKDMFEIDYYFEVALLFFSTGEFANLFVLKNDKITIIPTMRITLGKIPKYAKLEKKESLLWNYIILYTRKYLHILLLLMML